MVFPDRYFDLSALWLNREQFSKFEIVSSREKLPDVAGKD